MANITGCVNLTAWATGERRTGPNPVRDLGGDLGGQHAVGRNAELVGGVGTVNVGVSVFKHEFADGDVHAGGRGGNVHPAVDDLERALHGVNR